MRMTKMFVALGLTGLLFAGSAWAQDEQVTKEGALGEIDAMLADGAQEIEKAEAAVADQPVEQQTFSRRSIEKAKAALAQVQIAREAAVQAGDGDNAALAKAVSDAKAALTELRAAASAARAPASVGGGTQETAQGGGEGGTGEGGAGEGGAAAMGGEGGGEGTDNPMLSGIVPGGDSEGDSFGGGSVADASNSSEGAGNEGGGDLFGDSSMDSQPNSVDQTAASAGGQAVSRARHLAR